MSFKGKKLIFRKQDLHKFDSLRQAFLSLLVAPLQNVQAIHVLISRMKVGRTKKPA
jgi:hypothetical protein